MPGKFPSKDLMWGFHQHTDLSSGHVWIQPPFLKEPELASNLFMFQPQSSKIDFSSIWQLARSLNDLSPCFYAEGFEDLSKENCNVNTGDGVELTKMDQDTWLSTARGAVSILPPVFTPVHSSVTRFLCSLSWFRYYCNRVQENSP